MGRLYGGPDLKLFIRWSGPELFMSVSRLTRVLRVVFFCFSILVVLFDTQVYQHVVFVLSFASSEALSVIYLLPVMIHRWVRIPPHGPNKYMVHQYGSWRRGFGYLKASLSPLVIHYWPFQGDTYIVVMFINCYVVFHFLMFLFHNYVCLRLIQLNLDNRVATFFLERVTNSACDLFI